MALQLCAFPLTLNILVTEVFLGSVQTTPGTFFWQLLDNFESCPAQKAGLHLYFTELD